MTKAALLLADGFETIEALTCTDVLRRGGIDIQNVSCNDTLTATSAQKVPVVCDCLFDDYDFDAADLVIAPGGMPGMTNLRDQDRVCNVLRQFMADKCVASICASPAILAGLGLLEGRVATCYPGCEEDFPQGVRPDELGVYRDGNLVTASGMGWSLPFALEVLRMMTDDETVARVRTGLALQGR